MAARLKKIRLGDLLVQNAVISPIQLEQALSLQKASGHKLGRVLVESGTLAESTLLNFLATQLNIPFIDLAQFRIDAALVRRLPETFARRFRALPLQDQGGAILVGLSDPTDIYAQDELSRLLGKPVEPAVISEASLLELLPRFYKGTSQAAGFAEELKQDLAASTPDELLTESSVEDAPVVRFLNALLKDAVRMKASDVHIEPDAKLLRVRFRVDGVMHEQVTGEARIGASVTSKLKLMANLDIAERRLPQDGRFNISIEGRAYDIRMSTLPVRFGESIVLRLLDQSSARRRFHELGMAPDVEAVLEHLVRQPHGLLLVTGPTGSGKTTTLYAGLNEINSVEKKIITVEDPVEYQLELVNQVQVNARIGLDFALVLRSVLRQDPDVVMVGEIRDLETAQIALRAALTGHLVLSTLHTNDAASSLTRLVDLGLEPFVVGSSAIGVMAQRLVRRICPQCKTEDTEVSEAARAQFAGQLGKTPGELRFHKGRGCLACNNTGYQGRQGIHELIRVDATVRAALEAGNRQAIVDAALKQPQYRPLRIAALRLASEGVTSLAEVARVTAEMDH
ncbi:GspE/PulE family protein [Thermithiobacillus plumbiphilus]|uniref:GspE/PulE family protein n=1 Tax=Thermithiobacillus plumbiphilus TaxID=1729899 RepID=A0ABU9D656_9PROT